MQFVINNWYLFVGLVVVLALLIVPPLRQHFQGIKNINPAEAVRVINRESGVVVDVCEPQEFSAGHIPAAINVPLSGLSGQWKQIEKYKDKPIVVACRSGNRSLKAASMLRGHGFTTVYSLAGGLVAWQRENLPVEK